VAHDARQGAAATAQRIKEAVPSGPARCTRRSSTRPVPAEPARAMVGMQMQAAWHGHTIRRQVAAGGWHHNERC